jgi:signal peptidase II
MTAPDNGRPHLTPAPDDIPQPTELPPPLMRRRLLLIIIALLLAATALGVGWWAEAALDHAGPRPLLGPVSLQLVYNSGVSFSMAAALPPWIITAATAVVTAVLAVWMWRSVAGLALTARLGQSLVLAGAAANVADRWLDGKVTDYFHTGWFPTFNLADVFITDGVVLLLFGTLLVKKPATQ